MTRPTNQDIERYYFEQFRRHYPLPEGAVIFSDKPDVIVRGQRTLGVEIANLYLTPGADPSAEQVQRKRRLKTLELAQKLFLGAGGRRIELSVDFNPLFPIQDAPSLARALANIATTAETHPATQITRKDFSHIPELCFVHYNPREYADAKWRSTQVYEVPNLSISRLQQLVDEKTRKLQEYQPCEEYWLLLVVDLMDPAQDQEIDWPKGEVLNKSPFERILIYKPQQSQVTHVPQ